MVKGKIHEQMMKNKFEKLFPELLNWKSQWQKCK